MTALIAVWDKALANVPTAWLDRVATAALQAQRAPYPLTPADLLTAWDSLFAERQATAAPQLAPGEAPASYRVQALLPVVREWCQEHRDPASFPYRLQCTLLLAQAGAHPATVRGLLDATQAATLYEALCSLELASAVPPPPPPVAPGPGGTWQRLGAAL